ncbi:hypothetical protein AOLI_G00324650, partial [Acnodon oligacanthus]
GDHLSARQGLKKSLTCETSELDSNDELKASKKLGKRRPKPIHFYGDTDADSEDESTLRRSGKSEKASSACCAAPPPMPPPSVSSVQHFPFASPPIQTQLPASASASAFYKQKGSLLHFSIRANVLHLSIRANLLKLSTKNSLLHCCTRANLFTPLHWKQPPIPFCQGQTHSHQRQPPLPLLQRPPCLLESPTLLLKCLYQLSEWHQGESLFFV